LTTDSEAKNYCDLALASHSSGDGNVLAVLVLTIYERAQKVACPWKARRSGSACLLQPR